MTETNSRYVLTAALVAAGLLCVAPAQADPAGEPVLERTVTKADGTTRTLHFNAQRFGRICADPAARSQPLAAAEDTVESSGAVVIAKPQSAPLVSPYLDDLYDRVRGIGASLTGSEQWNPYSRSFGKDTPDPDIGLRYSLRNDSFDTAVEVTWGQSHRNPQSDRVSGLISLQHQSGVNVTLAAGADESEGAEYSEHSSWNLKFGYLSRLWDIGNTAIAFDYGQSGGIQPESELTTGFGAQVVQDLDDIGAELYLGAWNYDVARPGFVGESVFTTLAGARIKF